jgi:hypothetical protein
VIARLGHLAVTNWMDFDGYAVAHNLPDLRRMPLGRFCSYIWHMATRNGDGPSVAKFSARLWMPPKGTMPDARSPWSAENETRAFAAVKAMASG